MNTCTWLLIEVLLALLLASPASAAPPDAVRLLTFVAEAVDGVDVLVVTPQGHSVEHRHWDEMIGAQVRIDAPAPRSDDQRVEVRGREGRPAVSVVQQPRAANGYELRVLIDDGPHSGAAPLWFELWSVPVRRVARPMNVLVVTIDSLRPDRLGCYGHDRDTSPQLDRFAAQCVRFENAFSTSSFTPPSHASLLTSRYVGDHGLLTWNPLPEEQLTLSEILSTRDYRTGASVNLGLLSQQGLGQGFGWRRDGMREARTIVDDALEFIRTPSDQPFFLWLHLYDVHRPYGSRPPWTSTFAAEVRSGVGDDEAHYGMRPDDVAEQGLVDADLRYIVDRYDAGIAYADAQLAPLLAEVSTADRRRDTMVVITADHGESLLDHPGRLFTHDPYLFGAVTRVPLLVRLPGAEAGGSTSDALVSLIDVAPTILGALGEPLPPTFQGVDLTEVLAGGALGRTELFMECWGWDELKAVRSRDHLIIRDLKKKRTSFYDLAGRHGERRATNDVSAASRALAKKLVAFATRRPEGEGPPALAPGVIERLRELGYIGD